jgi:hypothetical protein
VFYTHEQYLVVKIKAEIQGENCEMKEYLDLTGRIITGGGYSCVTKSVMMLVTKWQYWN